MKKVLFLLLEFLIKEKLYCFELEKSLKTNEIKNIRIFSFKNDVVYNKKTLSELLFNKFFNFYFKENIGFGFLTSKNIVFNKIAEFNNFCLEILNTSNQLKNVGWKIPLNIKIDENTEEFFKKQNVNQSFLKIID